MLQFWKTTIQKTVIHYVGNKSMEEGVILSDNMIDAKEQEDTSHVLMNFFLKPFKDTPYYNFSHPADLELNDVYKVISEIFSSPKALLSNSKALAKILYECSEHPKIKGGELYIAYFTDCVINDEVVDAIGIFKSETKETFLEVEHANNKCDVFYKDGISVNKLDKGALILNTNKEVGFTVCIIDNASKGSEAHYWRDNFLNIKPMSDDYLLTNNILSLTKSFVTKQLKSEFEVTKADQVDYLNRSMDYFKANEQFDENKFTKEVFGDKNMIKSFSSFKEEYQEEKGINVVSEFSISPMAVQKQGKAFKSVLKLDKNFHIYIHGDKELIQNGMDDDGRKFYKIYYDKES
jgi:hypothetical protein